MDDQQFRQLVLTIKRSAFLIAACIVLSFFSQSDHAGWLAGMWASMLLFYYYFGLFT
jgi:hypothetical protein